MSTRIDWIIESALDRAFGEYATRIEDGEFTFEEVFKRLKMWGHSDAWADYWKGWNE